MAEERNDPASENEKKEMLSASEAAERMEKKEAERPIASEGTKKGFDFGRLLFGLLTLSFGLFLLGKGTGFIPEDLYIDIFQFWPVLIVVAGLSLLDTRRPLSFVLALLAFAAVAALVGTAIKDASSEEEYSGRWQNFPLGIEGNEEWEMRGPISGPVQGI